MKLPEYAVMRPNYIACHQNWASVPAKDFAGFLPHEATGNLHACKALGSTYKKQQPSLRRSKWKAHQSPGGFL